MGVKKIVAKQYKDKVNQVVKQFDDIPVRPPEGWLRTLRTALGMSGPQLAKRLGVTKARISKAEQDELSGSLTLKSVQAMAEAMGCRFVYAVIPEQEIEEVIKQRALQKARAQVEATSTHMALEAQSLSNEQRAFEVERIATEIVEKMPSDLWNDE
jgi:predicted DNA-binding mobile mystery protein A